MQLITRHRLTFIIVPFVLLSMLLVYGLGALRGDSQPQRPWMNTALTPDQRADALIAQMTLSEKLAMLSGVSGSYVGNIPANTRLGIPALGLEDGPAGVADGMTQVTAFPAPSRRCGQLGHLR